MWNSSRKAYYRGGAASQRSISRRLSGVPRIVPVLARRAPRASPRRAGEPPSSPPERPSDVGFRGAAGRSTEIFFGRHERKMCSHFFRRRACISAEIGASWPRGAPGRCFARPRRPHAGRARSIPSRPGKSGPGAAKGSPDRAAGRAYPHGGCGCLRPAPRSRAASPGSPPPGARFPRRRGPAAAAMGAGGVRGAATGCGRAARGCARRTASEGPRRRAGPNRRALISPAI